MHCGHKVILRDSLPQKIIISQSDKVVKNWIALGIHVIESENYDAADDYADKILEHDIEVGIAWFLKGCAAIQYSDRSLEAFKCWAKSSTLMSLDEKKDNFETFLYLLTAMSEEEQENLAVAVDYYLSGFDNDAMCSLYYEGAIFLFESSGNQTYNACTDMLYVSDCMLIQSIRCDNDCQSILDSYQKLLKVVSRRKVISQGDARFDAFISHHQEVVGVLRDIASNFSETDQKVALDYWKKNVKRRIELNDVISDAGSEYRRANEGLFGKSQVKKKAIESIRAAYWEIAYPTRGK